MKILSSLYLVCTQDIIFDAVEFQRRYRKKPFCDWWHIFNAFVPTCAVAFRTTHGKNNTLICSTEGFVPVASLYGVVRSPSSFIRYLMGRTGKIWSIVYINSKWIYSSKTLACTIRECVIVRKGIHVTLTGPFVYWCFVTNNVKWILRVCNSSLKSAEVNSVPASAVTLRR